MIKNNHILVILLFFSFTGLFAQDDSIDDLDASLEETKESQNEKDFLKFESHFITAVQERVKGNPDKALDNINSCDAIFPAHAAVLFEKAKIFHVLEDYAQAHHYCDLLLKKKPDFFWAKALKKEIYLAEQNLEDAVAIQKDLYADNPNQAFNLLKLYVQLKDRKAGTVLLAEIDKNAVYVPNISYFHKFFKYNSKNEVSEDENDNEVQPEKIHVTKVESTQTNFTAVYKELMASQEFHQLFTVSEQAIFKQPTEPLHYYYNGVALTHLKKHDEAVEILEMGLDFIVDNKELTLDFYRQLINDYTTLNNKAKAAFYNKLARQLQD